ncbi:unnamed protein product [Prunus armeniaca]|uniref:F-box associated domain-containing protein n=1 Tax=Prunus armeniaca TaxID=36596 RepID=A0A6J5THA2_PRUAR|nr:unnamed protein product [Prunus armeniaca]
MTLETNQYKVSQSFYPMVDPECRSIDYLEVEIYTIGTGVWRSIGNAPSDFLSFPSVLFSMELFIGSPLPLKVLNAYILSALKPSNFDHYPCLATMEEELDMWVMKDYGVQESSCY